MEQEPRDYTNNEYSTETCVRCSWTMGDIQKHCVDKLPHIFPSQLDNMPEIDSLHEFTPLECFVAGSISTLRPFANRHPYSVLPIARRAIQAMSDFKPPHG